MQRYEDIQKLILKLEEIHRAVHEGELSFESTIAQATEAISVYSNLKAYLSQGRLSVQTVKNKNGSLSFEPFDWESLDHAHTNPRP